MLFTLYESLEDFVSGDPEKSITENKTRNK